MRRFWRARARVFYQHLDNVCLAVLAVNVIYILVTAWLQSNLTLQSDSGRRCSSLRFHWTLDGARVKSSLKDTFRTQSDNVGLAGNLKEHGDDDDGLVVTASHQSPAPGQVCPEFPDNLKGELICQCEHVSPEAIRALWPNLEPGGRLRPSSCRARERLAIIIPYSNRASHLHKLIRNLLSILHSQNADAMFFVIEQMAPSMFNRATLHNIGFLEAQKVAMFDCFVFHDVDLVPMDDRILYRCADNPRHFPVSIQQYGRRQATPMYKDYFGGIVALTRSQYLDINGNSNLYFGWGGEDDDLLLRILNKGYQRLREPANIYKYQMLQHDRNDHSRGNIDRMLLLRTAVDRQDYEGLSTTKYKVDEYRQEQLYIWVSVSLNMTELLLTAPDDTRGNIKSLLDISKTVT